MEPIVMDIMKQEKMYPRGRGVVRGPALGRDSWRNGTQRKTKMYRDPSKTVCVKPSTSSRLSEGSVSITRVSVPN